MESVVSLVLLVFCELLCLFVTCLFLVHVYSTLFVISYCCLFSMIFFLFASRFFFYYFEILGNFLGKEEVDGDWGETCGTLLGMESTYNMFWGSKPKFRSNVL